MNVSIQVLREVLTDEEVLTSLSPEAYQTALIFWRDFEKSGIDLPPVQCERFVALSSEILVLGRQFLNETAAPRPPAQIQWSKLHGVKDLGMGARLRLQAQVTRRDLLVYPGSLQAQMVMRSAPAEGSRRKVYIATNSSTSGQIQLLERLLRARGELAQLVGKENFAHMTLTDKMAKSPGTSFPLSRSRSTLNLQSENVQHFLDALMDYTRPYARRALRTLSMRKEAHLGTPPFPTIQAWDRDYFSLRLSEVSSGEVWHTDVRKLEVVDEKLGILGWIYADVFTRVGKPGGAAHYTVRCSRRTDDNDVQGDKGRANERGQSLI